MIYYNSIGGIQRYRKSPSLNQSALTTIVESGIEAFIDKFDILLANEEPPKEGKEKEHWIIGNGVDTMTTMVRGDYDALYYKSELVMKPQPGPMKIIKDTFAEVYSASVPRNMKTLSNYKDLIQKYCNLNEYYMNRIKKGMPDPDADSRVEGVIADYGEEYWEDLFEAEGKQVLTIDQQATIIGISTNFKTHSNTSFLFEEQDNVDIVFQFEGYFKIGSLDCKILTDEIYIDHNRRLIRIIDFKTLGDYILRFNKAIERRRYDIQASFYYNGIIACLEALSKLIRKDLTGYTIANTAFVVESTVRAGTPLIFPGTDNLIYHGEVGGKWRDGWKKGLEIYDNWLQTTGGTFQLERMIPNGILFVDSEFDYVDRQGVLVSI